MGKYLLLGFSLLLLTFAIVRNMQADHSRQAGDGLEARSTEDTEENIARAGIKYKGKPETLSEKRAAFDHFLEKALAATNGGPHEKQEAGPGAAVLCYHRITTGKRDNYYITEKRFRWQMQYLAENCQVITTEHLVDYIRYRQGLSQKAVSLPSNAVVIQFDDNYRSVYSRAYPILRKLKLPWTFFVYKHHHKPNPEKHLRKMAEAGVDIQSHTMTHPWFHKPGKNQSLKSYIREMHWQTGGSRKYLETISSKPVEYLAYPFGTFSDLAIALCYRYGYKAMFAADGGYATADSPLAAIERILVTKGWSRDFFKKVVHRQVRYNRLFKPARLLDRQQLYELAGLTNRVPGMASPKRDLPL